MNQCVPSWELDENPSPHHPRLVLRANSNSNSLAPDVPTLDYEVAELTWENGQLAMHGLGPPRLTNKATAIMTSPAKYSTWDKPPPAVGTLESIVNQATTVPQSKSAINGGGHLGDELVSWFENNRRSGIPAGATVSVTLRDALVPCTNQERFTQVLESLPGIGTSTRVGSCSGAASLENGGGVGGGREVRQARVTHDWSSRPDQSVTGSATCGLESGRQLTLDTCERDLGTAGAAGFASTSLGSPGTTSSAGKECTKSGDEHDSVCRSRNQREARNEEAKKKGNGKLSVSTKRSRAAAIHNQSERKRRDKINQRMKTLQKLVPNSSKTSRQKVVGCQDNHLLPHKSPSCQTDKASMLDEVIEYLKQLQAQVQMMSRMNMSSIMLPLAMQQQLQMSMMAPMGLGVNMGMGLGHHHIMDMNTMAAAAAAAARPNNIPGMSPVLPPAAFVTAPLSWDCSAAGGDRLPPCTSAIPDPLSAFLACQSQDFLQPMTMDAYTRMAALYQQFQQQQQQQQQLQCPTIKTKVP